MVMHLIPDDDLPHAVTTECGCSPILIVFEDPDGIVRPAFQHSPVDVDAGL